MNPPTMRYETLPFENVGEHPVPASDYVATNYRWGDRPMTFVTDPAEDNGFVSRIRTAMTIEPSLRFALEQSGPGSNCVDIGANLGTYALPLAAHGCRVLAIEALPSNFTMLALASGLTGVPSLTNVHCAVGERNGVAKMSGEGAWAHLGPTGIEVPLITFDALRAAHRFPVPDIVKIDVEGAERAVLRGMRETLAERLPLLIIESNAWTCHAAGYTYGDLLGDLEALGYHLYCIRDRRLAPQRASDFQAICVADFVASPVPLSGMVGSFEVRAFDDDERMEMLATALAEETPHRWHTATVLARFADSLRRNPRYESLRADLIARSEPMVLAALGVPATV